MILAVVGRGFIAAAVAETAQQHGHTVRMVTGLTVEGAYRPLAPVASAVDRWLADHPEPRREATERLRGVDALVNAAGRAAPASGDVAGLFDANAVLPGVVARLAADAEVPRLVHVSTAAVQGRRDPLDESPAVAPFSPYSRSKAAGERVLRDLVARPPEVTIYRPTSVQGSGRRITQRLLRLTPTGRLVMLGHGDAPIPVCLIDNVAAGIVHVASGNACPSIVLQPWEGMTTRLLLESIGLRPTFVPVPAPVIRAASRAAIGSNLPWLIAPARRGEMVVLGQRQRASALAQCGFSPPVGVEGYRRLQPSVVVRVSAP